MADEKALELKSVIAKFNQSSSTLDSLAEKLAALSSATQEISAAQAGITEAHIQVRRIADEVGNVSQELRRANIGVQNALESVATFLHGTELGAMQQSISRIAESVQEQNQSLLVKIEEGAARERTLLEQMAALKSKIESVPEKVQKKLGWK